MHIHRRNKTARLKAQLKAKRRKERLRKASRLIKRRNEVFDCHFSLVEFGSSVDLKISQPLFGAL